MSHAPLGSLNSVGGVATEVNSVNYVSPRSWLTSSHWILSYFMLVGRTLVACREIKISSLLFWEGISRVYRSLLYVVLLIKYKLSIYTYPAFKRSPFKSASNISTKPYFCDIYMENPFIKFLVAFLIHFRGVCGLINTKNHNLFKNHRRNTFNFI